MREAPPRQLQMVGCVGHTHAVLIDRRYLRWRCADRNCPDARKAHGKGLWAFHVLDLETDEIRSEFEDRQGNRAA